MTQQLNSSFQTALQRRYLPVILSLILLGVLAAILFPPLPPAGVMAMAVIVVALVSLGYFLVYRALVFPVADYVVLDGHLLRVRRGRRETVVPVENISSIRSSTLISPETITLHLCAGSEAGPSITFIPPARFPSSREHPILVPLRAVMRPA